MRVFLAERLASYKLPRSIAILGHLPHGRYDEIDHRALRAAVAAGEAKPQ